MKFFYNCLMIFRYKFSNKMNTYDFNPRCGALVLNLRNVIPRSLQGDAIRYRLVQWELAQDGLAARTSEPDQSSGIPPEMIAEVSHERLHPVQRNPEGAIVHAAKEGKLVICEGCHLMDRIARSADHGHSAPLYTNPPVPTIVTGKAPRSR